ncbi:Resolvase, holliday junction-type, YqgF-like protein [mine drainage metagenome]|uniref:Resolvase, holliday junction-type, YqgF-like protein n=1 Tax=mine drainage metagenome TaxID=410659 RepID=T0ZUQ3_9ZZZZ
MPERVQRILAFDFGLQRVGIAIGDTLTGTAAPRPASAARAGKPDWESIGREVRAFNPGRLVVGAPYNTDGTAGALMPSVRRFANELRRRFALPVSLIDERFSSLEASAALTRLRARGGRRRVRREHLDSAAAAVILERWLSGEPGEELQ